MSQSLYDTVKSLQEKGHLPVLGDGEQTPEAEKKEAAAEVQQGGIAIRA